MHKGILELRTLKNNLERIKTCIDMMKKKDVPEKDWNR